MPDVYSTHLSLAPRAGEDPREVFLIALRQWLGTRWPADRAWLKLDEPMAVGAEDGSVFRWEPFAEHDSTLLEFTFRHPHELDASIHWSTQASFYSTTQGYQATLRVSNTGPEGSAALLTTRPKLVPILLEHFSLRSDGYACTGAGRTMNEISFPDFVRYELFDSSRQHPVILLTPAADGTYAISPAQIADEYLSLGELVVAATPASTFALTRELARRELSCFHGALRVYLPGFQQDADPYRHPLLTPTRLADAGTRLRLARFLALRKATSFKPDSRLYELRDKMAVREDARRKKLAAQLDAMRQSDDWKALAELYAVENKRLTDENAKLLEEVDEARSKVKGLQFALSERSKAREDSAEEEPEFQPVSVLEAVEYARELFPDYVRILPSALTTAESSPYSRPELVWGALRAIESIATRRRQGPLGKNLKDAFQELGLDYRAGIAGTTSRRLRGQYVFRDGDHEVPCEEHLCLGGGSYDPATCLRIYFSSERSDATEFIVGHVGRHLDGMSTT